jgi:hypothetical protein
MTHWNGPHRPLLWGQWNSLVRANFRHYRPQQAPASGAGTKAVSAPAFGADTKVQLNAAFWHLGRVRSMTHEHRVTSFGCQPVEVGPAVVFTLH